MKSHWSVGSPRLTGSLGSMDGLLSRSNSFGTPDLLTNLD